MDTIKTHKCNCPHCPIAKEAQVPGGPYDPSPYKWVRPCAQCSGPVGIVGDWTCPGCGTRYCATKITWTTGSTTPETW